MNNGEVDLGRTTTAAASVPAVAEAELPAATLGRYRLERELGAGAMGVVHAAFDPDLERRIALKVLRRAAATVEARERLLREARAMARLTHPNVVTVHEVGTADGRDFVAMEMIQGETLAQWLRAARRPPEAILEAFLAAGRGLAAAHAAGIVHRDFKPHNVLRSRDGRIVVTDFGLAREADGALPPELDATLPAGAELVEPTPLVSITVTGSLLGTPAYMAPEQCGAARSPRQPISSRTASRCGRRSPASVRTADPRSTSCAARSRPVPRRSTRRASRAGSEAFCAAASIRNRRGAGPA